MHATKKIPNSPANTSGLLEKTPTRRMLCSSVRTAKLLKNWLTTIPAWVMVSASR